MFQNYVEGDGGGGIGKLWSSKDYKCSTIKYPSESMLLHTQELPT
jgi:hypothetical protein